MAGQKVKKTKRPRKPKTSKGIHGGGGKVSLSEVQKINLNGNKGLMHGVAKRWRTPVSAAAENTN